MFCVVFFFCIDGIHVGYCLYIYVLYTLKLYTTCFLYIGYCTYVILNTNYSFLNT